MGAAVSITRLDLTALELRKAASGEIKKLRRDSHGATPRPRQRSSRLKSGSRMKPGSVSRAR